MTNKKEKVGNAFCHIYLIVLSLIAVFPLVWVLLCSVKSSGELTSNPTRFFPKHFTLENFTHVIQDLGFAKNIGNSLIIAIITTGIAIVISSMAAYGIVRFFPKLGSIMSKVLVATYMFPPILLAIPYSMVMAKLGLVNTRIGLIIVYLSFSVPYAVWMLVGFFKTVPLGIEEAAKVDGANKFQTFIQIVLPCEVGYMHMNDSDFQTLGAASILTNKVSEWKGETEKKWDGYHIFEEAKKGDKLCLLAIDEMVDILGEGIANICYVINPEVVVLGGGIMAQEQFLKERVECAVKRYLVSSIEEHTKIVFAKHQNDAGMLGAFYHFCSLH